MEAIKVPAWKRAVIKVGSALVAPEGQGCSTKHLLALARFIIESRNQGKEIVVVSSGAVAAGVSTQTPRARKGPRSIPEKQALAAIGQPLLMASWSRFFDFPCAQLLLTYDDIANRKRYVNAKNTLTKLLEMQVLPIVNENDTVAVEELKVGDNDNLAAYVAVLAGADLLIICSDVDGLFEADPRLHPDARPITEVPKINADIYALAGGAQNPLATGGMRTKIAAADKATVRGIDTLILNGTRGENFQDLLQGSVRGTIFRRTETPLAARKHWLRHSLSVTGRILIDEGAAHALAGRGSSLLPVGILAVEGEFLPGDAVEVVQHTDGQIRTVARGITQYGARDLAVIRGRQSREIEQLLGYAASDVVIHRDDLVLTGEDPITYKSTCNR